MPIKPELNVSGYRGIWKETLTDETVSRYTRAFAHFTKEDSRKEKLTILIGRDGRESGPEIKKIIIKELENLGVVVIDGDIMPTPTVLFSVRKHKYDGAIIITASHNPIEYNGLKFVNKEALFTIKEEVEKITEYFEKEPGNTVFGSLGRSDGDGQRKFSAENFRADKNSLPGSTNFIKEHVDQILNHI